MNKTNDSFALIESSTQLIDLNRRLISNADNKTSLSSSVVDYDEYSLNQTQEYAFLAFLVICLFLILFLISFAHNFCCTVFKLLRCCSNDSFCYFCNYSSLYTYSSESVSSSSSGNNSNEFRESSICEPLVLNDLKNKTNMNYYGVATNTNNNGNKLSFKHDTTSQTFDNYLDSSPIYSTNTFKSFNKQMNNDYLDIYNTFGNVCESINEMIAHNELEKIQTNLSKSLQEIQKIQIEMIQKENNEDDNIDLVDEVNGLVEESEEKIENMLPMPDLDSLNDVDTSKLDDIVSFEESDNLMTKSSSENTQKNQDNVDTLIAEESTE